MSDIRAQQAREHHRAAEAATADANRHRAIRDHLIRTLRAEDEKRWSYGALSKAVGCSYQLIPAILKTKQPRPTADPLCLKCDDVKSRHYDGDAEDGFARGCWDCYDCNGFRPYPENRP